MLAAQTVSPVAAIDDLRCTEVGSALMVHRPDHVDSRAQHLAEGVAADPDHTVVVLDLPPDAPMSARAAAAELLGGRPGSFRLVFVGEGPSGAATAAATWLADRLGRTVITHEGAVIPVGDDGLFVPAGAGQGWMRFEPGAAPRHESHRFPRPAWDPLPVEAPAQAGSSMLEPLPGGLWIRRMHDDPGEERHRRTLVECLVVQHEILTVVLGSPGAPALDLDDVARVWRRLAEPTRDAVRFVEFGPISCPDGVPAGQALAKLLDSPVTFYTGLPALPPPAAADGRAMMPRTVRPDGGPGWFPFLEGADFLPGEPGWRPRGVRSPVPGAREVAPGRFEVAPDAVLEVVPAGLWVRPADGRPTSEEVRAAPVDPERMAVVYEAGTPSLALRMRAAAEDTMSGLPSYARERIVLRASRGALKDVTEAPPASAMSVAAPVGFAVEASGPDLGPLIARPAGVAAASAPSVPPSPATEANTTAGRLHTGPRPDSPASRTAPAVSVASATTSGEPARPAPASSPRPDLTAGSPVTPARPVSATPPEPPVVPPPPARPDGAAAPDRPAPAPVPVLQAVPAAAARAVPPASGLQEERKWMRRAFSTQVVADAAAVGALLSQTPGLRSGSDTDDVLLDLVAVRLFLRGDRAGLRRAVAQAKPGPHVPLARCVAAGLARLPSFRGAVRAVVPGGADAAAVYEKHRLITEWAFADAREYAVPVADGDLEVRIWSSTGRRTALLEPGTPGRVVFGPGTIFRVLGVEHGPVPVVSLRETRDDDDGRPHPFDDIARSGLADAADRWTVPAPDGDAPRPAFAPGMIWTEVAR